ncbi:MAG: hypothetical protein NXI04_17470 [Planctomycetaceae bacterium]|nr:hypothetical protein [Planctomycetaceae bacterium]
MPPVWRRIADQMAREINVSQLFSNVVAEQVTHPKRRLKEMSEGQILVDCLGVGMSSTPLNRRFFRHDYVTHAVLRCRIEDADITDDVMDELGAMSEAIQTFFEETRRTMNLLGGGRVSLIKAEPFVHYSRSKLFGDGVFMTPIEFTWTYKR